MSEEGKRTWEEEIYEAAIEAATHAAAHAVSLKHAEMQRELLLNWVQEKVGTVPAWVWQQIEAMDLEKLHAAIHRILEFAAPDGLCNPRGTVAEWFMVMLENEGLAREEELAQAAAQVGAQAATQKVGIEFEQQLRRLLFELSEKRFGAVPVSVQQQLTVADLGKLRLALGRILKIQAPEDWDSEY
jgi:hypothetical protein